MGAWLEGALRAARDRELDRFAAAYAVVGWLLVQAASIALPAFDAPGWLMRWLIAATIIGFPLTLASGWIVSGKVSESEQRKKLRGREALFLGLIGLVAILSLGELAWQWSKPRAGQPPVPNSAPAGSVAVLPFDNMSGDPKQKYFSEGISDEIIGLLARNPVLRVAARTSSFYFEGKEQDIRTIAQKLNVRSVLEGSVRTDGGRVRIEASLVNAANGYQIWTQSYDRSLNDILAIQSQIAEAIAKALAPTLTGAKSSAPKPAQIDPAVYREYLQAQFYFDQRLGEGETPQSRTALQMAVQLFRKVVAQAPDFAGGQAALASALLAVEETDELDSQAELAVKRALALDPDNPEALQSAIRLALGKWDWNDGIAYAKRLKRSGGHSAQGVFGLAVAYEHLGLTDAATAEYKEYARLDPFSYVAWAGIARTDFEQARYQDVIDSSKQALVLHPDDPVTREYACVSLASLGRIADAKAILNFLSRPGIPKPMAFHCWFFVILHSEGPKAAMAFVEQGLARNPDDTGGPGDVGFMLSHAPQGFDKAIDSYERAFAPNEWSFNFYPGQSPPPEFFKSPRWIAFTKRPQFQRWLAAREQARRELLGQQA